MQYRGVFSTVEGYHDACRGYLEYRGNIMINVGDILITVGVFSTVRRFRDARGGYHEYRGGC